LIGGEIGIRTQDTLLEYTHFPGVRLRPLGHLSFEKGLQRYKKKFLVKIYKIINTTEESTVTKYF
jgi:hypothetical protein